LTTPTTSYHSALAGGYCDGEISSPEKNREVGPIQDNV